MNYEPRSPAADRIVISLCGAMGGSLISLLLFVAAMSAGEFKITLIVVIPSVIAGWIAGCFAAFQHFARSVVVVAVAIVFAMIVGVSVVFIIIDRLQGT